MASFRYFRFRITKVRDINHANAGLQMMEFNLYDSAVRVIPVSASSDSVSPSTEGPDKLIDQNNGTKWFSTTVESVTFDFGSAQNADTYSYITGNDVAERDPVRWVLEGSNDNAAWTELDDRSAADQSITTSRVVETTVWDIAVIAVDTVTVQSSIRDGETGVAYSYEGFAGGPPTSVTLDGFNVASFTSTEFNALNIRSISSDTGTVGPVFGDVTFEISNGVQTASVQTTLIVKVGYSLTTITTPDTTTALALYTKMSEQLGLTLATGDKLSFDSSDGSTISVDGNYEFAPGSLPKDFDYYENSSGKWYGLTMNVGGSLTLNRKLHATKLTAVKLTATKLTFDKL